jgi:hypothetical protein
MSQGTPLKGSRKQKKTRSLSKEAGGQEMGICYGAQYREKLHAPRKSRERKTQKSSGKHLIRKYSFC